MLFLSWNDKQKQADINHTLFDSVCSHIDNLKSGQEHHLAFLYPLILSKDRAIADLAAEAVHTYLSRLDAMKIIRLDRQFRQYRSMEWTTDWSKISPADIRKRISSQEAFWSVLRLGTLHPDGFFRERCMRTLADNEASFPYLVLRLNDWVKRIRDTAYEILSKRLDAVSTNTVVAMLPFLSQTKQGGRYMQQQMQEVEAKLRVKLLLHMDEISLDRLRDQPPATKRCLYPILLTPKVLSRMDADRLLEREKNGNEKARIIRLILKNYRCTDKEVESYLNNKSPVVRKKALELKYDRLDSAWEGLEIHLLDPAKGIRSDACYILQKHTDFDICSFYKANLHTPREAVAILGIGENGSAEDASVLTGYLSSDRPKLIKNAIRALSGLGAAGLDDIYWKHLNNTDPGISKAAYLAILRSDLYYGSEVLYRAYQDCTEEQIKKRLLALLAREPSWERLPFLLQLYDPCCDCSDKLQMLVHRAVGLRSVYARIKKEQADEIIQVLEQPKSKIPDRLKREILFDLAHITLV